MGTRIDEHKKDNLDKIRTGTCIELLLLLDNFHTDFTRLQSFLSTSKEFFNNQMENTICNQFEDIERVVTNQIDILLDDIDNSGIYCSYLNRYY